MNSRLSELSSDLLTSGRTKKGKSQAFMAKRMGRSLTTIQNWEAGISVPRLSDIFIWYNCLGVNPLRACLEYLHPDLYKGLTAKSDMAKIDDALLNYIKNVAPEHERRELAFCIFGETGSSWSAQLDELTARNHLPIRDRISISKLTVGAYETAKDLGRLRGTDHVMPDIKNVTRAISCCTAAATEGKDDYQNT